MRNEINGILRAGTQNMNYQVTLSALRETDFCTEEIELLAIEELGRSSTFNYADIKTWHQLKINAKYNTEQQKAYSFFAHALADSSISS